MTQLCVREMRGGVLAHSNGSKDSELSGYIPKSLTIPEAIKGNARNYLDEAISSKPAAATVMCASSVDAMLKDKGYTEGDLHSRINKEAEEGLITEEMKTWAHRVRMDANAQRHADKEEDLPTREEADETIAFVMAFAEYLIVLPDKVGKRDKD